MQTLPTVFVVDDDPAMRDSLRWLLESIGHRVEVFGTAQDFLEHYDPQRPGCLLLDVRMPGMSGLDLQDQLAQRGMALPVIIITGHAEVPMAVRALKTGAIDFIEKPFSDQLLLDRVAQAIEIDRDRRTERARRDDARQRIGLLTTREREVMALVVEGKSNKEMASALGLSPKTIEVHRARVMEKLEADSVAEVVRLALLANPTTTG